MYKEYYCTTTPFRTVYKISFLFSFDSANNVQVKYLKNARLKNIGIGKNAWEIDDAKADNTHLSVFFKIFEWKSINCNFAVILILEQTKGDDNRQQIEPCKYDKRRGGSIGCPE